VAFSAGVVKSAYTGDL